MRDDPSSSIPQQVLFQDRSMEGITCCRLPRDSLFKASSIDDQRFEGQEEDDYQERPCCRRGGGGNNNNRGRRAVATQDIVAGTAILRNIPFAFVVDHERREERCSSCFRMSQPSSKNTNKNKNKLRRCSRCKSAWYCSRRCQMNDFRYHKIECHEVNLTIRTIESSSGSVQEPQHHDQHSNANNVRLLIRTFLKLLVPNDEEENQVDCSSNILAANGQQQQQQTCCVSCSVRHFMQLQPYDRALDPDEVATLHTATRILVKHRKTLRTLKNNETTTFNNHTTSNIDDDVSSHQDFTERSKILQTLESISRRFRINNFGIVDSMMDLVGSGVYPLGALLNHSYTPNCILRYGTTTQQEEEEEANCSGGVAASAIMEVVAVRDIHTGEELTHSYVELVAPTIKRQDHLQNIHGFHCSCSSCQRKTRITLPTDYKDRDNLTSWILDRYNPYFVSTTASETDTADDVGLIQVPLDELIQPSFIDQTILARASMLQQQANIAMSNDDVLMELECLANAQKLLEQRSETFTHFSIDVYRILGQRLSSLIAARHSLPEEETTILTKLSKDTLDVCCKIVAIQCLALHKVPNHPLLGLQLFTLGDLYEENGYDDKASSIFKWTYDVLKICQGPTNFMVKMLQDKLK
eukprot:CAMPEP_0113464094 /NCGR_PEP_ID=MMETSP0014_2-20120614/13015_1 /TAXON_ID=2857 /ORGANISM="Nitzschia sp." /LENGTH=638 /DNA_ID=CAMNT_0000356147 /DNA_START=20 /DNA_END=1936 /DNA_ORIENTATION=- /assembly_acc=CAM_ASM_000159